MNLRTTSIIPALVAGLLLAGCQPSFEFDDDAISHSVRGDTVRIQVKDEPNATVGPDGSFRVDGRDVATTPDQREALRRYHAEVLLIGEHSSEIGKATGGAAAAAARDAVRARFSGDADEDVGERISQDVKQAVAASLGPLCDQVDDVYRAQRAVVDSGLSEFQPYARMTPESSERCRQGLASL